MNENDYKIKHTITYILRETALSNIFSSLRLVDYDLLQKAHDSIHEFLYLAPFCLPKNKSWHEKSAFLIYHFIAYDQAHRSFLEALTGYYNVAHIILRSVLELSLKGALWECLAHKKFRESAKIIKKNSRVKIGHSKRTILNWLEDIVKKRPEIKNTWENISGAIFDQIAPIFEDSQLKNLVPKPKIILKQLEQWKILEPYTAEEVYEIYNKLSAEVHVIPDKTEIGRRVLHEKDLFQTKINVRELEDYLMVLHKITDIGIVIELNILSDWIIQDEEAQSKLRERLSILQNLNLSFSHKKLHSLVKK